MRKVIGRCKVLIQYFGMLMCVTGLALPAMAQSVAPGTMKWEPGHYIMSNLKPQQAAELLQDFSDVPSMRGLQREYFWSALEPSPGNYDFKDIDQDLAMVKKYGKKLSIFVKYKYHAAGGQSSLPQYVLDFPPAQVGGLSVKPYYVQGKEGGGEYNHGHHANFGHPKTLDAFSKLLQALAKRYDGDPGVAFLQFSETAVGAPVSPQEQDNFIDGIMAMDQAARAAFSSTPLIQSVNFPRNRLGDLIGNLTRLKMGFGGPDVFSGSFDSPNNALGFRGANGKPGVYHYNMKNNGVLPIAMQVHSENLKFDTRELQLSKVERNLPARDSVKKVSEFATSTLKANIVVWQVFGKGEKYRQALEEALKEGKLQVIEACPQVYANTCKSDR